MTQPVLGTSLATALMILFLSVPGFSQDRGPVSPSSDGNLTATVAEATVRQGILTAKISLTNTSQETVEPELRFQKVFYVDFQKNLKHHGLKDPQGKYQAGPPSYSWGGGTFKERLKPGDQRMIWMEFPAPPDETKSVSFFLPGFLPLEEVQLITDQETEKAGPRILAEDKGLPVATPGLPLAGEVVDIVGLPAVDYTGAAVNIDQMMRDLGGKKVGQEIQVALSGDLLFDFDKWDIKKEAESTLEKLSKLIRNLKKNHLVIEGHTDAKGSDTYNLNLSIKRAQAVKEWLRSKGGLKKVGFQVKGYGEAKPVAANTHPDGSDNPEGRAQNRRVEIRILD